MDAALTTESMLRDMLNKPLYVAMRQPLNLACMTELLESHLRWMIAAERRGEIFASGPFVGDGVPPGTLGGMTIVRATSIEEAHELLSGDPFIREGVMSVYIKKWILMEGGFSVTVRFSNQSSKLM